MNFYKLKNVFFDLDGTLLDTAPDLGFALNKLLEQEGLPLVSLDQVRKVASYGSQALLALGLQIDSHHPDYLKFKDHFINFYHQNLSRHTKLFPGMDIVLDQLESQGFGWGVVTNKPSYLANRLLEDLGLADRCACIIGADTVSRPKPYPDSLLLACEMTDSLPAQCVYIGDAQTDIEAARQASMRSIAALYGYLPEDSLPECWQADYYIDYPRDILCWVKKQVL